MSRRAPEVPSNAAAAIGLAWGIFGVFATLVEAVLRLTPLAVAPIETGMAPLAWALYVGFVALNAFMEGYRGFQTAFSPRLAARAVLLVREPTFVRLVLAPLFLMALVDATRRRLLANWSLVFAIACLVLLVRGSPQPWRGIVDAGVVAGLAWGTLSTLVCLVQAARGRVPDVDPEVASAPSRLGSAESVQSCGSDAQKT